MRMKATRLRYSDRKYGSCSVIWVNSYLLLILCVFVLLGFWDTSSFAWSFVISSGGRRLLIVSPSMSSTIPAMNNNKNTYDNDISKNALHQPAHTNAPIRTSNGGYLHTPESKEKISFANKGRVPWNKGLNRTEQEKARIALGVRETNRLRLAAEASSKNMTLDKYLEQKEAVRKQLIKDKESRKTENGGYTLTQETRDKISQALKEKWKKGEVKKRDKSTYHRATNTTKQPHTDETKQKISASLRIKWSEDEQYRQHMVERAQYAGEETSSQVIRQRISQTLKDKWKDPDFRQKMMEQMKHRKSQIGKTTPSEHKQKISQTMKERWQDPAYRQKALEGMARKRGLTVEQFVAKGNSNGSRRSSSTRPKRPSKSTAPALRAITSRARSSSSSSSSSSISSIATMNNHAFRVPQVTPTRVERISFETARHLASNIPDLHLSGNLELRAVTPIDSTISSGDSNDALLSLKNPSIAMKPATDDSLRKSSVSFPEELEEAPTATESKNNNNNVILDHKTAITSSVNSSPPPTSKRKKKAPSNKKTSPKRVSATEEDRKARMREENKDLYKILYGESENDELLQKETKRSSSTQLFSSVFLSDKDFEDDEEDDDFDLDSYDPYGLDQLAKSRRPLS